MVGTERKRKKFSSLLSMCTLYIHAFNCFKYRQVWGVSSINFSVQIKLYLTIK